MSYLSLTRVFTGIAFWSAIFLAFGYPVMLLAIDQGLLPRGAFLAFVVAHAATLAIGYRYPAHDSAPNTA